MCEHGFVGACAECDGCGQQPEHDEGESVPYFEVPEAVKGHPDRE